MGDKVRDCSWCDQPEDDRRTQITRAINGNDLVEWICARCARAYMKGIAVGQEGAIEKIKEQSSEFFNNVLGLG